MAPSTPINNIPRDQAIVVSPIDDALLAGEIVIHNYLCHSIGMETYFVQTSYDRVLVYNANGLHIHNDSSLLFSDDTENPLSVSTNIESNNPGRDGHPNWYLSVPVIIDRTMDCYQLLRKLEEINITDKNKFALADLIYKKTPKAEMQPELVSTKRKIIINNDINE